MLQDKTALILDMNSTFMFGEDRFGDDEDFSIRYAELGGTLGRSEVQRILRAAYRYLDERYPDPKYREDFPTVREALTATLPDPLPTLEIDRIASTFAFHELGNIPPAYARALQALQSRYTLGAVVDIWAPKDLWLEAFEGAGIADLFSTCQFSSDHRIVKPSPLLFQRALQEMGVKASETLMIGDSPRRDLGGARAAGIDCVLVGGATHPDAVASFDTLLDIAEAVGRA
ncbi:MAG: HAD family hydrolase [Acidobacteriota bacterium]